MIELERDVAGELEMLLLILAHRHMRGVINQNIRRHQRGIAEKAKRHVLRVLAGLVLELRHALHPAHSGDAGKDPAKLRMFRHLALIDQYGFFGADAGSDKPGCQFAGVPAQICGVLPDRDRMQVNHAINGLKVFFLHLHETLDSTKVIAERQAARRLDAGKYARCESRGSHRWAPFPAGNRVAPALPIGQSIVKEPQRHGRSPRSTPL